MTPKILAFLLASAISTQSFAQAPSKVFVSGSFAVIQGCNYNRYGKFGLDTVKDWVKADLTKAGYAIANSRTEATNGLEVYVKVIWCGTLSGGIESHSGSIGWAVMSKGTSAAIPSVKDVTFNSGNQLAVAAGDAGDRHAEQLVKYLKEHVDDFVAKAFQ